MGTMSSRHMPARAWLRYARDKKPAKGRALRAASAVFVFLGIPLGIMAVLGPLAYAGIYVEPLKQFWRPWPPDYIKGLLAVGGFAGAVALLLYMQGRERGYQRGKAAGKANARNVAEGLGMVAVESVAAPAPPPDEAPAVIVEPPLPPP